MQGSLTEMTLRYLQGLLGEARFFKQEFVRPITGGTDKGATERAQSLGAAKAAELRARIGPYFLRREKQHVLRPSSDRCAARPRVLPTKQLPLVQAQCALFQLTGTTGEPVGGLLSVSECAMGENEPCREKSTLCKMAL